jgi:uncharacterized protein
MDAAENKAVMQEAFDELAKGNGRPFVDVLAEDKRAVRTGLLDPLFAQFATRYRNRAIRMIAEDDYVVIECRGDVTTKENRPYRNTYCYVCRLAGGKVRELTEYCDTELLTKALTPPWVEAAA